MKLYIAEMIAEETKGTLFHIETENPYPTDYNECIDWAKRELKAQARPNIKGDVRVEDYDVVFLGYPNWWGEVPMAVYTFVEKHCWLNKVVVPFCTHEGSGLGSTDDNLKCVCQDCTFLTVLAVRGTIAQKNANLAEQSVKSWLEKLKY